MIWSSLIGNSECLQRVGRVGATVIGCMWCMVGNVIVCVVRWEGRDMIVCGGWVGCDCVCSAVEGEGYDCVWWVGGWGVIV